VTFPALSGASWRVDFQPWSSKAQWTAGRVTPIIWHKDMYERILEDLRIAYDRRAEERDNAEIEAWKLEERQRFLENLRAEGKQTLLDAGSGPGVHAKFFQDQGLNVVCVDVSQEEVNLCHAKGLTAHVMDFRHLEFAPESFDAVFAMNSLLHVPGADLPSALRGLRLVLKPDGLFYWGQYGGEDREGIREEDSYEPKRFFISLTDESIQKTAGEFFEVVEFKTVTVEPEANFHFQSLLLRPLQE
jgi:SAM-dependent methyltransferase